MSPPKTDHTVESVMTREPTCCTPDEGVIECAKRMASEDVGAIPVVESLDTRRLVGVVTDRDLCMGVVAEGRHPSECRVEDCMTDEVVTVRPEDTLETAQKLMRQHQVRRICVVDESFACVGVVSQADVAHVAPAVEVKRTVSEISRPHG